MSIIVSQKRRYSAAPTRRGAIFFDRLFLSEDFEVGDARCFAGFGVDAFDTHLFEHPLVVDFLGGDDFESFHEAAVGVVAFDAEEGGGLFIDPDTDDSVLGGAARGWDFDLPSIARANGLGFQKTRIFPVEKTQSEILISNEPAADGVVEF